jgi:plasmid stabilization system protein ParE
VTNVEFHPEAENEFLTAVSFYEESSPGLGERFSREVAQASERIAKFPQSGRQFGHRLQRVIVKGFPYALVYSVGGAGILVVAVAHLRRRPKYWQPRT